jgi:hypothetical protein
MVRRAKPSQNDHSSGASGRVASRSV